MRRIGGELAKQEEPRSWGGHGGGRAESIPEARLARTKAQWWEYSIGEIGAVLGKWELGKSPGEARQGLTDRGGRPGRSWEARARAEARRCVQGSSPTAHVLRVLLKHFSNISLDCENNVY